MNETRQRFITSATKVFAERGFYGTSIAAVSEELPFTKQALLHHFGSKEKLYAEVLKKISDQLMAEIESKNSQFSDPRQLLEETLLGFYRWALSHPQENQLLMRELLDNRRRAETSQIWYLKTFLEVLRDTAISASSHSIVSKTSALSVVYQLLGAITYFAVSEPTLTQMFGKREFSTLKKGYESDIRKLVSARID